MKKKLLHYIGFIVMIVGIILMVAALIFGYLPQFNNSISDYMGILNAGSILFTVGLIVWLLINE